MGIFLINICYFSQPAVLFDFPVLIGDTGSADANIAAWFFTKLYVEGSMYGLFSILFGASALLILDTVKMSGIHGIAVVDRYYRRMLWLILFGLVHAYLLLSPMEILFSYGVLGLFLFPLRNLKPVSLVIAGTVMVLLGAVDFVFITSASADELIGSIDGQISHASEIMQAFAQELTLYHSNYRDIFVANQELAASWQTINLFEDHVYDAGGMMLIGMGLYKTGLLTGKMSLRFYLLLAVVCYLSAVAIRLPELLVLYNSGFSPVVYQEMSTHFSLLARPLLSLGHIGFLLALYHSRIISDLFGGLAAAGRMALTNYVLQSVFSISLFYGFGFSLYGELERYQLLMIGLLFGCVQIIYSLVWLRYFRFGPLEWLWRLLVAMKAQPFMRQIIAEPKTTS